jgi:iron(II)-dependent oxidoreductase
MAFDRSAAAAWYRRNRARSREIFDLLTEETYYSRPIALRHPIVFYDGHLPGFSFNTLVKKGLGRQSIDPRLETLFARGIDPHETQAASDVGRVISDPAGPKGPAPSTAGWPARDEVRAFADEADRQVIDAILHADVDQPGHPLLDGAEGVFTILEHEVMHQETLLYMWHRLPFEQKRKPAGYRPSVEGVPPRREWVQIPAGCATLGVERGAQEFGWDNEHPALSASVPAFAIERHDVTNEHYLEFVDAGGYRDPQWWLPEDWTWVQREDLAHPLFWERDGDRWHWRGMFDRVPLPAAWPVYVSQAEASAYARWRGARLPTEAEFQRAAYGSPEGERRRPWGDGEPDATRGVFDFASWDPEAAGSHPKGASNWGVEDLVGNGWEWTSTPFGPFPGFQAMASYPEYSADFFDQQHMVMKGASPVTAKELLRPSFRNWFRSRYPYVYATFRCAT